MKRLGHVIIFPIALLGCYGEVRENEKDRGMSVGMVEEVSAHGTDLVVKLKGDKAIYYLNRYLTTDRSIDAMKLKLLGRQAVVKHFAHSTSTRPIDTLFMGKETFY